jgi:hypothetical protein
MIRSFIGLYTLIVVLTVACSEKPGPDTDPTTEIIALAKLRSKAVVESDTAALSSILDKRFRYINIWGESLSREKYMSNNASLDEEDSHWISQDIDSIQLTFSGNSALITFRVLDKFVYQGDSAANYCRSTFIYEKQDGQWKCMLGHTTKIE